VPLTDPAWNHIHILEQVPAGFLQEVEHLFSIDKELEDNTVMVDGWTDANAGRAARGDTRSRFSAAG
jgi:inorganic pyrophosphatase